MRSLIWFPCLFFLAACTSSTDPVSGPDYSSLLGTWKTVADTSFSLSLTRICCGDHPIISGSIRQGTNTVFIDPISYARMYPIQKPDSTVAYGFELSLTSGLHSMCYADAIVQNGAGKDEFTKAEIPDSASLAIRISASTQTGCDSNWTPTVFNKIQ
jgi:hypothetical protein